MEFYSPKIKKCPVFSKKSFFYILGNRNFQEETFRAFSCFLKK